LDEFKNFINIYNNVFLIINPTKEKFNTTLMNRVYHDMLRLYSNELEKDNTLFISQGFSFDDEHIRDITKRSLLNPSLKMLLFAYNEDDANKYKRYFSDLNINNVTIVCSDSGRNLTLNELNQILLLIQGIDNE